VRGVCEEEPSKLGEAAGVTEGGERDEDLEELLLRHQHEAELAAIAMEHCKSENIALHQALQVCLHCPA
jgi:hypothetical protein